MLLLDKGFSCIEVGEIILLDDYTIRIYRNNVINQGVVSLLSDENKGRTSNLTPEQLQELDQHIENNTYGDTTGIIDWIQEQFNILYSVSGINALLKRMGFVYKKPVLTPCKANYEKQKEFVESSLKVVGLEIYPNKLSSLNRKNLISLTPLNCLL